MKKLEGIIGLMVSAAFIAGLLVIVIRDDSEPDKIPLVSGCFESMDLTRTRIDVEASGEIFLGNVRIPIRIVRDKGGLSIIPRKRLERERTGIIIANDRAPLKIRIGGDYNSLSFIDEDESIMFVRVQCAG